jgi:acid-sensing ion channel, other
MFRKEITEDGVCFTFNGLDVYRNDHDAKDEVSEEWALEDGYRNSTVGQNVYPRPGSRFPLIVTIAVNKEMNSALCKGPIEGYKVYLHLPNEVPQISKHFYMVPYKQTMKFSITPKMITTAVELRELSAEKRQCFFSDERFLRFFRYYTQNNCELECTANLTLSECGCLRFNMPSK